jgi:ABC-type branched-subunit amino acid transport system ATPase component
MLDVDRVDVSYGKVQVLFGVSMHVDPGETLALLGTNGAGKSTMLKAVSGLVPTQAGRISFAGEDVGGWSTERRVGAGIVQLSGGNATFPGLTVQDNLLAGAFTILRDRATLEPRLERVLDLFPILRDRADQRAGSLSGGEQQMLAVAKVLLLEPRLLIIDELSLGLAPAIVGQLLVVIEQLKDQGQTMLIVEQSLNVAAALADRAVFMEKGEVRFDGTPDDLIGDGTLARAVFLGAAT